MTSQHASCIDRVDCCTESDHLISEIFDLRDKNFISVVVVVVVTGCFFLSQAEPVFPFRVPVVRPPDQVIFFF